MIPLLPAVLMRTAIQLLSNAPPPSLQGRVGEGLPNHHFEPLLMKLTAYLYLLPLALAGLSACSPTAADKAPVALAWQDEGYNDNTGTYDNTFVIKNISRKDLAGNWDIYYSQLPRDIKHIQNDDVDIEAINANYFRISPTDKFRALAPGVDTIFLTTNLKYSYLSSSTVKEIAFFGGDISGFVHPEIAAMVREKIKEKQ